VLSRQSQFFPLLLLSPSLQKSLGPFAFQFLTAPCFYFIRSTVFQPSSSSGFSQESSLRQVRRVISPPRTESSSGFASDHPTCLLARSGPGGVGVATVADLFPISERGRALSLCEFTVTSFFAPLNPDVLHSFASRFQMGSLPCWDLHWDLSSEALSILISDGVGSCVRLSVSRLCSSNLFSNASFFPPVLVPGSCDISRSQHYRPSGFPPRDLSSRSFDFFVPLKLLGSLNFFLHILSQVLEARIRNPSTKTSYAANLREVWATRGAVGSKLSVALKRPPTMLFTDGVLAVSCIYYAFIYANLFIFLVSVSSTGPSFSHRHLYLPKPTLLLSFPSHLSDPHSLPRG